MQYAERDRSSTEERGSEIEGSSVNATTPSRSAVTILVSNSGVKRSSANRIILLEAEWNAWKAIAVKWEILLDNLLSIPSLIFPTNVEILQTFYFIDIKLNVRRIKRERERGFQHVIRHYTSLSTFQNHDLDMNSFTYFFFFFTSLFSEHFSFFKHFSFFIFTWNEKLLEKYSPLRMKCLFNADNKFCLISVLIWFPLFFSNYDYYIPGRRDFCNLSRSLITKRVPEKRISLIYLFGTNWGEAIV